MERVDAAEEQVSRVTPASQVASARPRSSRGVQVTLHGPAGAVDLVVPPGATARDVAREYTGLAGGDVPARLLSALGTPLPDDADLGDLEPGTLLVAVDDPSRARAPGARRRGAPREVPSGSQRSGGAAATAWFTAGVALAALAGWFAALAPASGLRTAALSVLAGAALVGILPVGRLSGYRVLAAPAFAAAAAFAVVHDPEPARLPMVVGLSALVAAVVAGLGRALDVRAEEGLRVWMLAGSLVFAVAALAALLDAAPQVVWAVLLVTAVLAARFVPGLAVDVPDQYVLDLERLAVTAWSARDRPTRRRGRIVVPREAVAVVAERGTRMITASSVAVAVVAATCAPLLLLSATLPLDRIGARCLVGFGGAALLLAARSYRHAAARAMLRLAGLACWLPLGAVTLSLLDEQGRWWVVGGAVALAGLLVVVAVALGRGWRSAWWSQRAETAEALCGASTLAALVVAAGLFRHLWEIMG